MCYGSTINEITRHPYLHSLFHSFQRAKFKRTPNYCSQAMVIKLTIFLSLSLIYKHINNLYLYIAM